MQSLSLWHYTIPIQIIFSTKRRRSLSLQIKQQWIIIRAPKHTSQQFIDSFLEQRESWIIKHREKQLRLQDKKKVYTQWSPVSYFGEDYPVKIETTSKKRSSIRQEGGSFIIELPESLEKENHEETIQKIVEKHLKNEAKKLLPLRTLEWATEHLLRVDNVFVKTYRTKYGQCKWWDISYDWRIVQFPEWVIDHIILHELTHIIHKHHQKSFWDQLKKYDTWFDTHLKRLKENGGIIHC